MIKIDRGVTKYDIMPIPPIEAHSQRFEVGPISIWVEYRLLDDTIAALHQERQGYQGTIGPMHDRGVALHVFGEPAPGQPQVEFLRFDCFEEGPHYHYISHAQQTNDMVNIDPHSQGDPLRWALDCIRTRLPQMLERAGAGALAARVDPSRVEQILPLLTEAAYRVRFEHDDAAIHAGAVAGTAPSAAAPGVAGGAS
ncbi:MAG: hypothetical protein CL908_21470 [Deltaproteobacteria bacterium]|nr:hypothetical protein [Deltaproteobacteria bacterium]